MLFCWSHHSESFGREWGWERLDGDTWRSERLGFGFSILKYLVFCRKLNYSVWLSVNLLCIFLSSWTCTCLLAGTADQAALESNIPLSPQWLYVKPSETKVVSSLSISKKWLGDCYSLFNISIIFNEADLLKSINLLVMRHLCWHTLSHSVCVCVFFLHAT